MIAIHHRKNSFSDRWVQYCDQQGIPYKLVNCYDDDVLQQMKNCDALLWHYHHGKTEDNLLAKSLLFSLEQSGKKVFPNFNTAWHFDDKLGQKYLLESLDAPRVRTFAFYDKKTALEWAQHTSFPKVFKLRSGAGAANVMLIHSFLEAKTVISKCFGNGFSSYNTWHSLKDRWRNYKKNGNFTEVLKGVYRLFIPPAYAAMKGKEVGYAYFQDFIPNNDSDYRVVVIGGKKAFAIKRMNRPDDFRASGSGFILYEKELFPDSILSISFSVAQKMKSQCAAFDYVLQDGNPLLVEVSYGFSQEGYDKCVGYWDEDLRFYPGPFNPYGWIIDDLISENAKK
jgi:glutathione synthase/RimK-type ligase-like ATP-grasp enzyme